MSFFSFFSNKPNYSHVVSFLQKNFHIRPDNIEFYLLAFRHKSASEKLKNGTILNNERLEFLGDAILDSIIADFLYSNYPNEDEGFLTKMRAKIVSRTMLGSVAEKLDIPSVLTLKLGTHDNKDAVYGNALEALIGAIYLDKGFRNTKKIILEVFQANINLSLLETNNTDYKSFVIEWAQKERLSFSFTTTQSNQSVNAPHFEAKLVIDNIITGIGKGRSKKKAEQEAAKMAYSKLSNT